MWCGVVWCGVVWCGVLYEFIALPFGLSSATHVFTKLTKPIVAFCRGKAIIITILLDDIAVLGDSFINSSTKVSFVIQLLHEMGFVVNYVKSDLVPRQLAVYIGYLIDSIAMRTSLPHDKLARISSFANDLFVRKHCSVRVLAQMIGLVVSSC